MCPHPCVRPWPQRVFTVQPTRRLCPLLRRDFQRWLHWKVTDAEIPGAFAFQLMPAADAGETAARGHRGHLPWRVIRGP